MENAIAIRPMIYKEAREAVDQINSNMNNVRYLVLDLYEREGWVALGYQSWRECVTAEFQNSQAYLYRQLEAAQTEKVISPIGEKIEIPESQLRPLTKLKDNPEQQREAWQKAVETAPEGKVTAAHVSKVVKEMTEPEKPKPYVLHKPIIEKELVSEDFQQAYDSMIVELKNCRALKWKTTSYKAALEMMKNLVTITEQMGR